MQFKPKTEKEIQEAMLWPKGEYDFECIKAEKAVSGPKSKSPGTEFIKIKLTIFDKDGLHRFVDSILHPALDAQLRHFCVAGNLLQAYESGTLLPQDCVGVCGRLKLKVEEAKNNFPAKNAVADYVTEKKPEPVKEQTSAKEDDLDGVPF